MSTDIKRRKIRRLKGSVLFTTLVVMILILLIMLAAIGIDVYQLNHQKIIDEKLN